eukprot:TRINITY_DN49036_c0_g1_i1.p1 TRINITY_DN49036_c0_g1~~TRINITY_DN49036_c0_g1_i1.p1  ORF type:complete len:614 (+),score=128.39 TRINITY_DN49036_c0_g1_i1:44-1843(+)
MSCFSGCWSALLSGDDQGAANLPRKSSSWRDAWSLWQPGSADIGSEEAEKTSAGSNDAELEMTGMVDQPIVNLQALSKALPPKGASNAKLTRRRTMTEGVLSESCKLEYLQGSWLNMTTGAKVSVAGTSVTLNGQLVEHHQLVCNEDGDVQTFSQKSPLLKRQTLGPNWSAPSELPGQVDEHPSVEQSKSDRSANWAFYGKRDSGPNEMLVWREGNREVLWERASPIVTLDMLQGSWVNSMGAKICVQGTEVSLNGIPMKLHPVKMREDGAVMSIGMLWQLAGRLDDGQLEFKEAPNREAMTYARSIIWTPVTQQSMDKWKQQMKGLGYEGSAKDPLARGVEGCVPGTSDAKASSGEDHAKRDKEEVDLLSSLIHQYCEPSLVTVPPIKVIPDFTNRAQTGLSLEHVHFIATNMTTKGFKPRTNDGGHDIPVLVRECPGNVSAKESIKNWRERTAKDKGFAPWYLDESSELFTSLGNGHFYQALNVIRSGCQSIYERDHSYSYCHDKLLKQAIEEGVPSLIVSSNAPRKVRAKISELLNSKREYRWTVNDDGSVDINEIAETEDNCSQVEALSKFLNAEEWNCLVRAHMGVTESSRIGT